MAVWRYRQANTIQENTHNHPQLVVEVVLDEAVRTILNVASQIKECSDNRNELGRVLSHPYPHVKTVAYAQGIRDTLGRNCIH